MLNGIINNNNFEHHSIILIHYKISADFGLAICIHNPFRLLTTIFVKYVG